MPKRCHPLWFQLGLVAMALLLWTGPARAADLDRWLTDIKSVKREGAGNESASRAARELGKLGPDSLIAVLSAMNDADPIAANWLRASVDSIAERALAARRPLPAHDLQRFVLNTDHAGPVRRLAYEWLAKIDPTAPDRLIPGMLNDPSNEMRRDAVVRALAQGKQLLADGNQTAARTALQTTFAAARDRDQVLEIAKQLEEVGDKPDLTRHFGCIQTWRLIAPFDNTDKSGFHRAFPPEQSIDLSAKYEGKGAEVHWVEHTTADPFGIVDLNKVLGKHMGAVAYGVAYVDSPREQAVSVRAGSSNAIKIWLNGSLIATRDEYHHGMSMDQYQAVGQLRAGRNTILIKVCQNEQKEDWAQNWTFQVRVCDLTGGGFAAQTPGAAERNGKP